MAGFVVSREQAIRRLVRLPYAPLVLRAVLASLLLCTWLVIHFALVSPAKSRVAEWEAQWSAARERLVTHKEALRVLKDLQQVLNAFPVKRDFVPLAWGITEEAKRNRVTVPSLTYQVGEATGQLATKAVFQGSLTGRYADLRRFIHQLELAEELLFIEDLDVVRAGPQERDRVTFRLRIATYLRAQPSRASNL